MPLSTIIFVGNLVVLFIALVLAIMITRAGALYAINYGDTEVQTRLKFRILKLLIALLALGIAAAIANLVVTVA